jgi:hypothetical protein
MARGSRFSAVSAPFQPWRPAFSTSLGLRGEVVIMMLDDGSKEMEITLIDCQADEPDKAACHHIP